MMTVDLKKEEERIFKMSYVERYMYAFKLYRIVLLQQDLIKLLDNKVKGDTMQISQSIGSDIRKKIAELEGE